MATRQEIETRKTELLQDLRDRCFRSIHVGGMLPSLRSLSDQHQVSVTVVRQVMQQLREEGLIETTSTSGSRVVVRQFNLDQAFLYGSSEYEHTDELCGFTERMGELGAYVLEVPINTISSFDASHWKTVRGLWANTFDPDIGQRIQPYFDFPVVGFASHTDPETDDSVRWADFDGAVAATQHLVGLGHQHIVFVGEFGCPSEWGAQRAEGFRHAMAEHGLITRARYVLAPYVPQNENDLYEIGKTAALELLGNPLPDAIIACNDAVAGGFLNQLSESRVPLNLWPAIIGFDDVLSFGGQSISSMRMDPRAIGTAAADLLWQRAMGQIVGPPTFRSVPMRLVPRMTSQARWASRVQQIFPDFPVTMPAVHRSADISTMPMADSHPQPIS